MKRYLFVINFVPVIFTVLLLSCVIKLISSLNNEFNMEYYENLANRCSDAAAQAMITGTSSVGTDYVTLFENGAITVDPDVAVREYGAVLCLSDGMLVNESNIESELLDKVKVLAVAAYDGYYIYSPDRDKYDTITSSDRTSYKLVGTPKLPYTYTVGNKNYALTMASLGNLKEGMNAKAWEVEIAAGGTVRITKDTPTNFDMSTVKSVINGKISDEFNYKIKNLYSNGWRNNIFIPNTVGTISTAQPILGPTCLALMDLGKGIQPFGIGGTRLQTSDRILAFEPAGTFKKYYGWESQILKYNVTINQSNFEVFDSPTAAARAGYYLHPAFY